MRPDVSRIIRRECLHVLRVDPASQVRPRVTLLEPGLPATFTSTLHLVGGRLPTEPVFVVQGEALGRWVRARRLG